jgi:hypothetical protein
LTSGRSDERSIDLDLLRRLENELLGTPGIESAIFLDRIGRVLLVKPGDRDQVVWRLAELRPFFGRVELITHNHPRGTSLTPEDLELARIINAREVDAVTTAWRFRLLRLEDSWPPADELDLAVAAAEADLVADIGAQLRAGSVDEQTAELLFYRALWRRVAARFPDRLRYLEERRES